MKIHPSLTLDKIMDAVKRAEVDCPNPGFCTACGEEQAGCIPDARNYECESCGERKVFGAEELLIMLG